MTWWTSHLCAPPPPPLLAFTCYCFSLCESRAGVTTPPLSPPWPCPTPLSPSLHRAALLLPPLPPRTRCAPSISLTPTPPQPVHYPTPPHLVLSPSHSPLTPLGRLTCASYHHPPDRPSPASPPAPPFTLPPSPAYYDRPLPFLFLLVALLLCPAPHVSPPSLSFRPQPCAAPRVGAALPGCTKGGGRLQPGAPPPLPPPPLSPPTSFPTHLPSPPHTSHPAPTPPRPSPTLSVSLARIHVLLHPCAAQRRFTLAATGCGWLLPPPSLTSRSFPPSPLAFSHSHTPWPLAVYSLHLVPSRARLCRCPLYALGLNCRAALPSKCLWPRDSAPPGPSPGSPRRTPIATHPWATRRAQHAEGQGLHQQAHRRRSVT